MQVANCPKCGTAQCVVEITDKHHISEIPATAGFWCLNCNAKWLTNPNYKHDWQYIGVF
jgi:hypothetical protein